MNHLKALNLTTSLCKVLTIVPVMAEIWPYNRRSRIDPSEFTKENVDDEQRLHKTDSL
ncbi:MAG: hypothetical protein ACYSWW_05190 [Planctomycetota bacterium]|jgi:hypothetical protein